MQISKIIVVAGHPCTGKTSLAEGLSDKFRLPLITKDNFKELLFDNLGYGDPAWSRKLGITSVRLMFLVAKQLVKNGVAFVMESNFFPDYDTPRLTRLKNKYKVKYLQINMYCDKNTLLKRFAQRSKAGNRHPGHIDTQRIGELEKRIASDPLWGLDLDGEIIKVDTTNFEAVDPDKINERVTLFLQ